MAWTTPKTWSVGEVLTSSDMNTYVSNNTADLRLLNESGTATGNYTLALGDEFSVVAMNASGSATVTVPAGTAVAFPTGTIVNVYNMGTAGVTIAGASGVTVRNAGDVLQYREVSLRKRGTDEWVLA